MPVTNNSTLFISGRIGYIIQIVGEDGCFKLYFSVIICLSETMMNTMIQTICTFIPKSQL